MNSREAKEDIRLLEVLRAVVQREWSAEEARPARAREQLPQELLFTAAGVKRRRSKRCGQLPQELLGVGGARGAPAAVAVRHAHGCVSREAASRLDERGGHQSEPPLVRADDERPPGGAKRRFLAANFSFASSSDGAAKRSCLAALLSSRVLSARTWTMVWGRRDREARLEEGEHRFSAGAAAATVRCPL